MANGKQLKKLFQSFAEGDSEYFNNTAKSIIEDERRKNHFQLADELEKILNSFKVPDKLKKVESNINQNYLHLLPKDKDSNLPLFDIKPTKYLLEDLVLDPLTEGTLKELIQEYEKKEILSAFSLEPRKKILFCGPPGCGKTISAQAIAGELDLPLLYTRFDSIVSSYLGETALNLRKIFDFTSKGTWILFFDEFDAISKQRDSVDEHGELKRVVNSFLQMLDNYEGDSIIIAATNHQQLLDNAVWRRFDEVIFFDKPTPDEIPKLLIKNLKRYPTNNIDYIKMSEKLTGNSHSDIERLCLNVIRKAILQRKSKIDNSFLEKEIELLKIRNNIYKTKGGN